MTAPDRVQLVPAGGIPGYADVIGQEHIAAHFDHAVRSGAVSHAYLLTGESVRAMTALAEGFAAALQCTDLQTDGEGRICACGRCPSCIRAAAHDHPDIITVEKTKQTGIGIDDVRRMRRDVQVLPYEGNYKVYIVPDAQTMTAQAQNALLKTLEEPPAYAVVLLLAASTETFLPTVLSRCVVLGLRPVEERRIAGMLREKGVPDEQAMLCARLSGGSPEQADALAQDGETAAFISMTAEFMRRLPDTDYTGILRVVREQVPEERVPLFLDLVQMWVRDVAVEKRAAGAAGLIFEGELQYIRTAARRASFEGLGQAQEAILTARRRLRAHGSAELILAMMALSLREALGS